MIKPKISLLAVAMAAALLAGCSQEETPGVSLSPGEYPLILTAGGLKAVATPTQKSAPSTRGTVDNDWRGVTSVAVEADNEVKEYKVDGDGNLEKELDFQGGGNYIMIDYENFTGIVDLTAEYKE